ncbi:MAG: beta-N-acetylhexosaminidase [Kiritimatiellae bacterium]|nr:beta-N-acetylhexosaminidase [Kiritimatiellia bacterium]
MMKAGFLISAAVLFAPPARAAAAVDVIPAPREIDAMGGVYAAPADFFERLPGAWTRDASLPAGGYALSVSSSGVEISAADEAGAFYAVQTLRQLAPTNSQGLTLRQVSELRVKVCRNSAEPEGLGEEGRRILRDVRASYHAVWPIPHVKVRDWPRYRWRAVMLDEARHFFGKAAVLDLLDRMAEYKMNVFHWHLTDDQGWRIDLPGFPELVKYGSVRPCSVARRTEPVYPDGYDRPPVCIRDDEPYGPYFYSPKDIEDVLARAKALHITVVPEIEFPGHARAMLAAHPEFSCAGGSLPRVPRVDWGIERDVVCGANMDFYRYMERLLQTVCDLFPDSPVIHIGGDECFCERWKTCPRCQTLVKKENLPNERALQSRMTKHFADFIAARGRRIIGWDGLLTGAPLDPSKTVVYFRKPRPGAYAKTAGEAAALGHDVVAIPTGSVYFDFPQGLEDDPHFYNGARSVRLCDVYACDPLAGVQEKDVSRILGAECLLWTEYVTDRGDLEWKVWPRACAMAEALWLGDAKPGYGDFARRMRVQRRRLLREGINSAPVDLKNR